MEEHSSTCHCNQSISITKHVFVWAWRKVYKWLQWKLYNVISRVWYIRCFSYSQVLLPWMVTLFINNYCWRHFSYLYCKAKVVTDEVISDIIKAKSFSLIAEFTWSFTYRPTIRYIKADCLSVEWYLIFLPNTGHKAIEMFNAICKVFNSHDLDTKNCQYKCMTIQVTCLEYIQISKTLMRN